MLINEIECLIITLEGLDKFNENLLFAHQLRNLILILSSLVIYHGNDNMEIIKQNFNNIFKHMKAIKSSSLKFELTKEYICQLLCEINIKNEDENINSTINKFINKISSKKFFKSFELINKYNKVEKSLNNKIKWIKENIDIKRINKIDLTGNLLCDLIESLCEKFNINDTPIINNLLENILLSKLKEISEVIETQFKTKFMKYINENKSQNLNYYDLINFYFNFHKKEGFPNLCKSTIASLINLKDSEEYLIRILNNTFDNINILIRNSRNIYEDLISKFGNNILYKNEPNNIKEVKDNINNLTRYLKKYFIPIITYKTFNFDNSLGNKVNKYIINKLNCVVQKLGEFEENEKKLNQKKLEELIHIIEEKDNKIIDFEKSLREMKNKEREYLNLLEIEKKRYETLEKYFQNYEIENQKKLNDLQNQLNELIKENKKIIPNEDYSLNDIKSDYIYVKNKLDEYKNAIFNCNNQLNLDMNSYNLEKSIKLFNTTFEEIINNKFNQLYEYKEKENKNKTDLEQANFEINKLKTELEEQKQNYILLKKQLNDEKNKYENLQILFDEQKSLIKIQEEKIKLQLI